MATIKEWFKQNHIAFYTKANMRVSTRQPEGKQKKQLKHLHWGYEDIMPKCGGNFKGWGVEKVGGKRKERGGGRKIGPTELPCRRQ